MKRLFTFLFLSVLLFSLTACGTDPNVQAFKEKLTASDWQFSFMGMNGITFRFNEDDTGQATSDLKSGSVVDFKYTITDATDGGESAVITITPAEENQENSQGTTESELDQFTKMKAEFIPGGLSVVDADNPNNKAVVFKPITKN